MIAGSYTLFCILIAYPNVSALSSLFLEMFSGISNTMFINQNGINAFQFHGSSSLNWTLLPPSH